MAPGLQDVGVPSLLVRVDLMFMSVKNLLWILIAAWMLGSGVAWAGDLASSRAKLEVAQSEVSKIEAEISNLEARLQLQVREVEALKRQDALVDYALQEALAASRSTAEELSSLTSELRAAQSDQQRSFEALMGAYDEEIVALEGRIFEVSGTEQQAIIGQLERLQREREQVRAEVPSVLSPITVPELAEIISDDPEELMAAADELVASEAEMNDQLQDISARIDALEQRRRVLAYAEDTSDERALFGEEDTPTQISGQERVVATRSNGEGSKQSDDGLTNEGSVSEPTASPTMDDARDAPEGMNPPPSDFSMDPNSGAETDGDTTGGLATGDDGLSGFESMGDRGPTADLGDTPEVGSGVDVIRSDADLNAVESKRSGSYGRRSLERELKKLKTRKKKLERSLDEVRDQKSRLEERASELGF